MEPRGRRRNTPSHEISLNPYIHNVLEKLVAIVERCSPRGLWQIVFRAEMLHGASAKVGSRVPLPPVFSKGIPMILDGNPSYLPGAGDWTRESRNTDHGVVLRVCEEYTPEYLRLKADRLVAWGCLV